MENTADTEKTARADIVLNDPESIKFRRNSNTMVILGLGVILFAFWTIIKLLAQFVLKFEIVDDSIFEELGVLGLMVFMITLVVVLAFEVLLRLFVGLRAIRDGMGKKVSKAYLVFAVFLLIDSLLSVLLMIDSSINAETDFLENYISLFMELSSFIVTVELFIAALSVRRYRAKKAGRGD